MKKYLLIAGLLTVFTFNSAQAQGYYYENDGYYNENPRYERRVNYQQPQYRDVKYVRTDEPRYRRMTNAEVRQYQEKQIYKSEAPVINNFRPYIGLDVAYSKMDLNHNEKRWFKDNTESFDGVFGVKINRFFALEAYYQQSLKADSKKNYSYNVDSTTIRETADTSICFKSYGMDLIGSIPINQEFELLAALGIGQYDFKTKAPGINISIENINDNAYNLNVSTSQKTRKFDSPGIRMGLGAQYNFNKHFALRGMVRYVKMTDDEYVKKLIEASLGLRYMF